MTSSVELTLRGRRRAARAARVNAARRWAAAACRQAGAGQALEGPAHIMLRICCTASSASPRASCALSIRSCRGGEGAGGRGGARRGALGWAAPAAARQPALLPCRAGTHPRPGLARPHGCRRAGASAGGVRVGCRAMGRCACKRAQLREQPPRGAWPRARTGAPQVDDAALAGAGGHQAAQQAREVQKRVEAPESHQADEDHALGHLAVQRAARTRA